MRLNQKSAWIRGLQIAAARNREQTCLASHFLHLSPLLPHLHNHILTSTSIKTEQIFTTFACFFEMHTLSCNLLGFHPSPNFPPCYILHPATFFTLLHPAATLYQPAIPCPSPSPSPHIRCFETTMIRSTSNLPFNRKQSL